VYRAACDPARAARDPAGAAHDPDAAVQSPRSRSFMLVLERVAASTRFTITAQYS
jgi:hypothetical protein